MAEELPSKYEVSIPLPEKVEAVGRLGDPNVLVFAEGVTTPPVGLALNDAAWPKKV